MVECIQRGSETHYFSYISYPEELSALAHGAAQGGLSELQGGKFIHGFISASLGSISTSAMTGLKIDHLGLQVSVSSAVGGTSAALTGGSFANGAVTGAFTTIFNHAMHDGDDIPEEDVSNQKSNRNNDKVNLKEGKVVTNLMEKFRQIHKSNGYIYPGKNYHVSDIIDGSTLPTKDIFSYFFGSMANEAVKGTVYFGDKMAEWHLVDRNYMKNYSENYISDIQAAKIADNRYVIKAMLNNETRIGITFYDYELYKTMCSRIFD